MQVRLQRFLAQCGVAARRKAEQLIAQGAVRVNGKVVTEMGSKVDPESDRVSVSGVAVHPHEHFYVLFNKPKGCVTTLSDPEGRRTVMDYLPRLPVPVAPVGRLDFYSEGVLLLTNDGELSAALQSPRRHVEKTYHVKLRGKIAAAHLEALRRGVRLDDGTITRPAQVDLLQAPTSHTWLVITVTEGKSRQLRRMAEALNYTVLKLARVAFAGLTYHGLREGDARELTQVEVNRLRLQVGLPPSSGAASRGRWRVKRETTDAARREKDRTRPPRPAPAKARASVGARVDTPRPRR